MSAYPNPVSGQSAARYPGSGNDMPLSSNQYFTGMPSFPNPGQAPSPTSPGGSPSMPWGGNPYQVSPSGAPAATYDTNSDASKMHQTDIGAGIHATGLQYPGMSQNLVNFLNSQIGQGISPFNQSTQLPTGGTTQPGQLSAGMNPLLAQLMQFFQTGQGGGMPGMDTLSTIANQGISALPEWQSMIGAQQRNIQQNQANLAEQFGFAGNLAGSPFATGMSSYMQQTTLDQNALLGQLQQQNILQGQIPVAQGLMSGATGMASGLQAMDQAAIDRLYQQFQTDAPQNNPLLSSQMGMATLYPPTQKTPTTWEMINSTIGALSGSGYSSSSGPGGSSSQISF